jgi:hypothetical protein
MIAVPLRFGGAVTISRRWSILVALSLLASGPASAIFEAAPSATPSVAPVTGTQSEAPAVPSHVARPAALGVAPVGDEPQVQQAPELPPVSLVDPPHVYFFDMAWTAPDVHLVLRNGDGGEAQVRVHHTRTHPHGHPDGPETRSSESYTLPAGAAAHPVYSVETHRAGFKPLDYLVVASDRRLHVSARAFGKKYAHELLPFEIDCRDSGGGLDDGTPYGLLCWIARNE